MPARRSFLWWGIAWGWFFVLTVLLTVLLAQRLPPTDAPAVFRGYHTTSFELSAFEPCGALGTQRYWLSLGRDPDPDHIRPGRAPGEIDDLSATTSLYLRFEGTLSAPRPVPDGYGYEGQYAREVTMTRVLAAEPIDSLKDIGLALLPGLIAALAASVAAPRLLPALEGATQRMPTVLRDSAVMTAIFIVCFLATRPLVPEGCLQ